MQQDPDAGYGGLVYFAFDLLELNGDDVASLPLIQRKGRLAALLKERPNGSSIASTRAATAKRSEEPLASMA